MTGKNIALFLLTVGLIIFAILFFSKKQQGTDPTILNQLKDQQKELQRLSDEKQLENEKNRERDSVLWQRLTENNKARDKQIIIINRDKDEKIDRINSPDFNNDSIRRAFAN